MTNTPYIPPKVWHWDSANGGKFSSINRPTAGATHTQTLARGAHDLQLYSLATPNGQKVTILLEELLAAGHVNAEYDAWIIDISNGDQFGSDFVALNPNSKIPALYDQAADIRLFESGAILVYLADKFGAFLSKDTAQRAETMNWLFWQMGSAPYLGGGFGHFYAYAPEKFQYPIDRFAMETKRQMDVLDKQLAKQPYIAGNDFSIADIAIWPWYGALVLGKLYDAGEFLDVTSYKHLTRWAKEIADREAVKRGQMVNRAWGDDGQLKERHSAADIDAVLENLDQ